MSSNVNGCKPLDAGVRTRDLLDALAARGFTLPTFPWFIDQTIGGGAAHRSDTYLNPTPYVLSQRHLSHPRATCPTPATPVTSQRHMSYTSDIPAARVTSQRHLSHPSDTCHIPAPRVPSQQHLSNPNAAYALP